MTDNHDLSDWLRLSAVPGLGAESQRSLLAAFGLPQQVFMAGRTALAGVVGKARADAVLAAPNQEAIERALAWAQEPGNHILTLADDTYPHALLDIPDPPLLLYVKGALTLLQRPALAIVGARSSSAHGEANAEAFARHLASQGFTIVSGLAAGIDTAAHRGALGCSTAGEAQGASTIAVIGTGIDRIYPSTRRWHARLPPAARS